MVEGLQVVTGEGILSGSGHLSARIPGTETFLINPRFAGVLADPKDICTVDFDGKRIAGKGPIPSETHIHTAIYRSRLDVGSVLHCHARYSLLLGLLDIGLIPFNREARIFADGVPIFHNSHGIVVVGATLEEATMRAIKLDHLAQMNLQAASLGKLPSIPQADIDGFLGRRRVKGRSVEPLWRYYSQWERRN